MRAHHKEVLRSLPYWKAVRLMTSVKDYMRKDIITISTEASATEASKTMSTNKVGYIIVLEKGQPVGIVTERPGSEGHGRRKEPKRSQGFGLYVLTSRNDRA